MAKAKELVKLESSPVSDGDRLSFAIIIAISFHLLLALGIRFVLPQSQQSEIPLSLDVTLAHRESVEAPEKADFIGQKNQQGAGDNQTAERPTTELEYFRNTEGETSTPSLELIPQINLLNQQLQLITTNQAQSSQVSKQSNNLELNQEPINELVTELSPPPKTLRQYNVEQSINQQLNTRGLKKRQIAAAVMSSPDDAPYLEAWRNKVLQAGNQHYSPQAKHLGYGSPIIKASINKDGSLLAVVLQKSSGNKLIDQMALELIKIAAPFDPLPESMRHNTDVLEIIRLLRFHPDTGISTK